MGLPAPLAFVLIIAGLWSLIVLAPFLRNVLKSPASRDENGAPTRSMTVGLMKISSAMVFNLATVVVGIRALAG